jgi:hypothetical protein
MSESQEYMATLRGAMPRMLRGVHAASAEVSLGHALRIGAGLCFIGHGAFGLITKPEWVPYFAVVGIPEGLAYALMPLVGIVDILAGLVVLASPRPIALLYMMVWGIWTATLRPLAGDMVWETLERAGNYGVPLALIVLIGGRDGLADWFGAVRPRPLSPRLAARIGWVLRGTCALLLGGHGALAVLGKPLLVRHFDVIGLDAASLTIAGGVEVALAVGILLRPRLPLLLIAAAWKLVSEALFLVAGAPIWEFIERAGSYVAPIALAMVLVYSQRNVRTDGGIR